MREFLKSLQLEDDKIESIMGEYGKKIENVKNTHKTEVEGLQSQLSETKTKLSAFDGKDFEGLQKQVTDLTKELEDKENKFKAQIAERDFLDALNRAITSSGGRNAKAIIATLDVETLRSSKNQNADIQAAIEENKKNFDYLYQSKEPINNPSPVGATGGSGGASVKEEEIAKLRAIAGLKDDKK